MTTLLIADDHPLFREALRGAVARVLPGRAAARGRQRRRAVCAGRSRARRRPAAARPQHARRAGLQRAGAPARAASAAADRGGVRARGTRGDATRARPRRASASSPSPPTRPRSAKRSTRVLDGDRWAPAAALSAPAAHADEHDAAQRLRDLTPQQFRVLQMLGAGLLNKQIGYELGVSEATVKAHVTAILRKLGAIQPHPGGADRRPPRARSGRDRAAAGRGGIGNHVFLLRHPREAENDKREPMTNSS